MAIINHSRKFIFVHVPKAAGTSVTNMLSKYTSYRDLEIGGTTFGEKIQSAFKKRFGISKHATSSNLQAIVGEEEWDEMFTFSIVRNPYSRVISTYKFLNEWEGTPTKFKKILAQFSDINDYILSNIWEESNGPDNIFRPQTFWLTDNKDRSKILVNFVGRLETLDNDLNHIISKIEGIKIEKKQAPQLNKTSGNFTLSKKSIDKINEFYSRDFHFWGYEKQ